MRSPSGSWSLICERAFDGSAAKLVLQALAAGKTSPEELAEIKKLVADSFPLAGRCD